MPNSNDFESLPSDQGTNDGFVNSLQLALQNTGSKLKVAGLDKDIPIFGKSYVHIESKSRFCQVMNFSGNFSVDFWDHGVCLVNAGTSNVDELAKAIHLWIESNCSLDTLKIFSFISIPASSYAHERGDEVEQKWQSLLDSIPKMFPELNQLVIEAYKHPKLRQLFPFTSLNTFCLSRCTGYPYTKDLPIVIPAEANEYEVVTRDGKGFGPGNANWAVKTVEANLPENCGPAIMGTVEELDN